jgi:ribosomal protein S27E
MAISVTCGGCGRTYSVKDELAGRKGKCNACGAVLNIPALATVSLGEEQIAPAAAPPRPAVAAPAPAPQQALLSMRCQGCGGSVEYHPGQGRFVCKYCRSEYEASTDDGGHAVVRTIQVITKKLESIDDQTRESRDIASEQRLQKKAQAVQDKIDFKYIEFDNSFARKAGSAAVLLCIIGGVALIGGLSDLKEYWGALLLGLILAAAGVGLFLLFKQAKARYVAESAQIKQSELEPIYEQLRRVGAVLDGGAVSVGYTESTSVPLRYCVCCHKNITPAKGSGGGGALSGVNLWLTIITCGAWIPAWIMIAALSKAGGMASRAMRSGACPQCGTTTLFPARIESV